jgi:hypothetical protein
MVPATEPVEAGGKSPGSETVDTDTALVGPAVTTVSTITSTTISTSKFNTANICTATSAATATTVTVGKVDGEVHHSGVVQLDRSDDEESVVETAVRITGSSSLTGIVSKNEDGMTLTGLPIRREREEETALDNFLVHAAGVVKVQAFKGEAHIGDSNGEVSYLSQIIAKYTPDKRYVQV